jgi:hypothetical protein
VDIPTGKFRLWVGNKANAKAKGSELLTMTNTIFFLGLEYGVLQLELTLYRNG